MGGAREIKAHENLYEQFNLQNVQTKVKLHV